MTKRDSLREGFFAAALAVSVSIRIIHRKIRPEAKP